MLLMVLVPEADMFQNNACPDSLEMILVVRYVPGVKQFLKKKDSARTGPDPGFDSVRIISLCFLWFLY